MHDTLKKPREIIMVSYAVRFPELAAKSKSVAGEVDMDPAQGTSPERQGYNGSRQIAATLGNPDEWESQFQARIEDLDGE
ncbi:hypothetical protein PHLCEN_2v13569 [Hermanssonia centrifuga]|uniref:Uncharacterized protein n=1 Tax=Hermanssonia centrifuga TaxID=98765 RepID=A0A2R6NDT4_9APHY|nr:hypothetical protein PHLCEN_2v13569 [Hermanssonia centrifuga]